jgi:hypothetical protein
MNCLAEERFVELLDRGGLEATQPEERAHLDTCETCRDCWATIAAAGEILTDARPRTVTRATRMIPSAAAAAMLLAIIGVILVPKTPAPITKAVQDPLVLFQEGTPEEAKGARLALLKSGRKALPALAAARPKLKGSARFQALQDLIWDIKVAASAQDPADLAIFRKLETMKIDLAFENTKLEDIVAFVRSFSGLNLVVDPTVEGGIVDTFSIKDSSLRTALEVLSSVKGLEFDLRYGVLFFATPMRLWSTDPGVGLPTANHWTKQTLAPGDVEASDKLRSIRITVDMQTSPLSAIAAYLTEISALKFKVADAIPEGLMTLKVQDLVLPHALELLTLPYGCDVKIEGGAVVFFDPKK